MPAKRLLLLLICLPALFACASASPPMANPELPYPPSSPPQVGNILHLPTGFYVQEADLLRTALDHRLVYVGETHDNPAAHRVQLTVLQAMADRYPGQVALGLEMFTVSQQPILDGWVAGELEEKEFMREWGRGWSLDFDLYRDLLFFARERGMPIIALNADKDLVRQLGRQAPAELEEGDRQRLPEMDLADPYHRSFLSAVFGGHDHGEGMLDGFHRVQTLWDEMMAQQIVSFLLSPQGESMRMVVLAGSNHIRNGFGIPRRAFRRLPTSYLLVGSRELTPPKDPTGRTMDVQLPSFPMPAYDFVVFTEYEDLQSKHPRLGVFLEETEGRVVIRSVMEGSAAEQAGLLAGDSLLSLDGEALGEVFDLTYALRSRRPGDNAVLAIIRDGQDLQINVQFPEKEETP
jgi:uncharacterized iron-regulated protein